MKLLLNFKSWKSLNQQNKIHPPNFWPQHNISVKMNSFFTLLFALFLSVVGKLLETQLREAPISL